jgi:hypothetical protein
MPSDGSSGAASASGNSPLAATFFALLIDFDSGTGRVVDHSEARTLTFRAVALH